VQPAAARRVQQVQEEHVIRIKLLHSSLHNHGHLYVDRQWLVVQHELHRGRLEWRLLDEEGVSHWLENLETQRK
jgi:hypothetical protein